MRPPWLSGLLLALVGCALDSSRSSNSSGYQDHHRTFQQEWGHEMDRPGSEQLQTILLKAYSKYPIPQLIGINP